jgi:hypothetical protein
VLAIRGAEGKRQNGREQRQPPARARWHKRRPPPSLRLRQRSPAQPIYWRRPARRKGPVSRPRQRRHLPPRGAPGPVCSWCCRSKTNWLWPAIPRFPHASANRWSFREQIHCASLLPASLCSHRPPK